MHYAGCVRQVQLHARATRVSRYPAGSSAGDQTLPVSIPSPTPSPAQPASGSAPIPIAALVGGVAGGVVALAACLYVARRRSRKRTSGVGSVSEGRQGSESAGARGPAEDSLLVTVESKPAAPRLCLASGPPSRACQSTHDPLRLRPFFCRFSLSMGRQVAVPCLVYQACNQGRVIKGPWVQLRL
jgi:hypothetical protein